MDKDIWLYSWDDEYFESDGYKSKKEAIEAAKEELRKFGEFKRWVYVGKRKNVNIPNINAETALEHVQESIDDRFGECGRYWFEGICVEDIMILGDRISEVFKKWIDEFGYNPKWFMVVDVEEVELSEATNEGESGGSEVNNN
ncbi:TPA: hypothetical protein KSK13_003394 [Clostridioides difficile]|nr:hypothetical protein [Clostridioides difficile]